MQNLTTIIHAIRAEILTRAPMMQTLAAGDMNLDASDAASNWDLIAIPAAHIIQMVIAN